MISGWRATHQHNKEHTYMASALFYHCSPMKRFSLTHLFFLLFTHTHSSVHFCFMLSTEPLYNTFILHFYFSSSSFQIVFFSSSSSFSVSHLCLLFCSLFVSEPYPPSCLYSLEPCHCDIFCYDIIFVPYNKLVHWVPLKYHQIWSLVEVDR